VLRPRQVIDRISKEFGPRSEDVRYFVFTSKVLISSQEPWLADLFRWPCSFVVVGQIPRFPRRYPKGWRALVPLAAIGKDSTYPLGSQSHRR